jgi:hypothetical protein
VGVDGKAQHPQAVREVVLPYRRVPLDQELPAPDVVDEDIEAALLGVDALDERLDLRRLEVVDLDCDPLVARGTDELGRLLDRLRLVILRAPLPRRATGAIDRRARLTQRNCRASPSAARRAGYQSHLSLQRVGHAPITPCER